VFRRREYHKNLWAYINKKHNINITSNVAFP
jgi:hypothetical protein